MRGLKAPKPEDTKEFLLWVAAQDALKKADAARASKSDRRSGKYRSDS